MAVIKMGTTELKQFSIPIEGGFTSQMINGGQCLVPDLPANKNALRKFIFQ